MFPSRGHPMQESIRRERRDQESCTRWSVDLTASSVQRPIGGMLAFIAIVWMFVWALRADRGKTWNVVQVAMALALLFLVIGAVLGIALGLQLAKVEIVPPENAEQLGGAHPAAMVVCYVILAGTALIEWLLRRENTFRSRPRGQACPDESDLSGRRPGDAWRSPRQRGDAPGQRAARGDRADHPHLAPTFLSGPLSGVARSPASSPGPPCSVWFSE